MTYWIVTMYRNGDREKHSYVLGVFSSFEQALKHGNAEEAYRGGKYLWEHVVAELDKPLDWGYIHLAELAKLEEEKK